MKLAGTWRIGLRRKFLNQIASMGRNLPMNVSRLVPGGMGGGGGPYDDMDASMEKTSERYRRNGDDFSDMAPDEQPVEEREEEVLKELATDDDPAMELPVESLAPPAPTDPKPMNGPAPALSPRAPMSQELYLSADAPSMNSMPGKVKNGFYKQDMVGMDYGERDDAYASGRGARESHPGWSLHSLFPHMSQRGTPPPAPEEHTWPEEAADLVQRRFRRDSLGNRTTIFKWHHEHFSKGETQPSSQYSCNTFIQEEFWASLWNDNQQAPMLAWCNDADTGILDTAFQLGRGAPSKETDLQAYVTQYNNGSFRSLITAHPKAHVTLERLPGNKALLIIRDAVREVPPENRYLIDTKRNVLLERQDIGHGGKLQAKAVFKDFIKVSGNWWPTTLETTNGEGQLLHHVKVTVQSPKKAKARQTYKSYQDLITSAVLLDEPLPTLEDAQKAMAAGEDSIAIHLVLLHHFAASQQWDKTDIHFEAIHELSGDPKSFRWLELRYYLMKGRSEELRQLALTLAKEVAAMAGENGNGSYKLAQQIRNDLANRAQPAEVLEILEILKPVYANLSYPKGAFERWEQDRLNYLRSAGKQEETNAYHAVLAKKYPKRMGINYASVLYHQRQDPAAAFAWLDELLPIAGEQGWEPWRTEQIHNYRVQFLENQGRWDESKKILEGLLDRDPTSHNSWMYSRYINALLRLNEVDKSFAVAKEWLQTGDPYKIGAATNVVLNQQNVPKEFHEPLSKVVRKFYLDPAHAHLAANILNNHRFRKTDAIRDLRTLFLQTLLSDIPELPLYSIQSLLNWIRPNDPVVETETRQQLTRLLEDRWSKDTNTNFRHSLGQTINEHAHSFLGREAQLQFLRRQVAEGPEGYESHYKQTLFQNLLTSDWSQSKEDEAWALLYQLYPEAQFRNLPNHLLQLTAWVAKSKYNVLTTAIPKKENLSRTQLAGEKRQILQDVRKELATRLDNEVENAPETLLPWMLVEKLYYSTKAHANPAQIAKHCWDYLDRNPLDPKSPPHPQDAVLYNRYLAILEYLAIRPGADPEVADRLLQLFTRSIEGIPEKSAAWKHRKYRLLVALDRPDELSSTLRAWIRPGNPTDNHWRRTLGILLAELNRIPEAIQEFENITKEEGELPASDWKLLANWYLVQGDKEGRESALQRALDTQPEWKLRQRLQQIRNETQTRFNKEGIPSDPDPEVPRLLTVLLRKSTSPNGHLYYIGEIYKHSKDFRLLECLPEGVLGHSTQAIYPYLQNLHQVLRHIRDEATADTILGHLAKVRQRSKSTTDQRALHLLVLLVERRAAELQNEPGPHIRAALASMQAAFKGKWEDGERLYMARLLASLGKFTSDELAKEQLGQLKALHLGEKPGTLPRLHVAAERTRMIWMYGEKEDAIEILSSELFSYRDTAGQDFHTYAQGHFNTLNHWYRNLSHFVNAEAIVLEELERDPTEGHRRWLKRMLFETWLDAFNRKGTLSIGGEASIYPMARDGLLAELAADKDPSQRYYVNEFLMQLFRHAHRMKTGEPGADLHAYAYGAFEKLLEGNPNNYHNMVNRVADTIRNLSGPKPGLSFLIHRYENQPEAFDRTNNSPWYSTGWNMAYWRHQAKDIGDLEPRLLAIVLKEIRRDLEYRNARQRSIYSHGSYFWTAKKEDFLAVTESVLCQNKDSSASLNHIASYLWSGLRLKERAIEVLQDGLDREILDEDAQRNLLSYLESTKQYERASRLLIALIDWRPDNLSYRTRLMNLYYRLEQTDKLLSLLDLTEAYLKEKGRWQENNIYQLASTCLSTKLDGRCVKYYSELIPLHQRTQPNRGIGNGTLSNYYNQLARAHGRLGNTIDAVEAASGAIVSWGNSHSSRKSAVSTLEGILRNAEDPDGFAVHLEKEAAKTQLENPILRKALGKAYHSKRLYDKAIPHLQIAVELQPNNPETHKLLVQAYEKLEQPQAAIRQLLQAARLNRREFNLYQQLATKYNQTKQAVLAERALTSIVEALPTESESHQALAKIREKQGQWLAAVQHWRQVAELRALEPTGLLGLAKAQQKAGQEAQAKETLQQVLTKD